MKIMKYKIDYQNAMRSEHMGMTYGLEECIQIIARDCGFDDCDLEWYNTATGIAVTVERRGEAESVIVARLIKVEAHTNEEESRELLDVLVMDIAGTGDLSDALSELTCNTESTYRIIRKALEVLSEITDMDEPAMFHTSGQRAVFIARAMLLNIVKS